MRGSRILINPQTVIFPERDYPKNASLCQQEADGDRNASRATV